MLRDLGHPRVAVLDGGCCAWMRVGGETMLSRTPVVRGLFAAHVSAKERGSAHDGAKARSVGTIVLDTCSLAQWNGSYRYWPARAGRIPGAVRTEWSALLADDGTLDRSDDAIARLRESGLDLYNLCLRTAWQEYFRPSSRSRCVISALQTSATMTTVSTNGPLIAPDLWRNRDEPHAHGRHATWRRAFAGI